MKEIPLVGVDDVALVDDDCYDLLTSPGNWCRLKGRRIYAIRSFTPKTRKTYNEFASMLGMPQIKQFNVEKAGTLMHHLVIGYPPSGEQVDHINRNKLDNRRENLRFVSQSVNTMNRGKLKNNTSGYIGVSKCKGSTKRPWEAKARKKGVPPRHGYFSTKEEAAQARDKFVLEIHGHLPVLELNFPEKLEEYLKEIKDKK